MKCTALTLSGEPCRSPDHIVGANGRCTHHDPALADRRSEIGRKGGEGKAIQEMTPGFVVDELPPIVANADAKAALDAIRIAILTRKTTHAEGAAAARAIDTWLKADAASITHSLVNELRSALDEKSREIEGLRKQLGERARTLRVAK